MADPVQRVAIGVCAALTCAGFMYSIFMVLMRRQQVLRLVSPAMVMLICSGLSMAEQNFARDARPPGVMLVASAWLWLGSAALVGIAVVLLRRAFPPYYSAWLATAFMAGVMLASNRHPLADMLAVVAVVPTIRSVVDVIRFSGSSEAAR